MLKQKKIIALIVIAVAALIIIVAAILLNPKESSGFEPVALAELPSYPENLDISGVYGKQLSDFDFEKYTSVNSDIVGYINIYGTGLEEIIAQSTNGERDYYLYRDWMGNNDKHGTVYFDNNFDFTDPNDKAWILYGHNNANGTGFPELHKYDPNRQGAESALAYYKEHHLAQLDTVDEAGTWQIFALFVFSNNEADGEQFNFLGTDFSNDQEYQEYIDNIRIRSQINTPVSVTTDDTIAVLCTCISDSYNVYGNYTDWRLIMAMRKVPYGEEAEFDASLVEVNPNPLMPDIWHKNTGTSKPTSVPSVPGS